MWAWSGKGRGHEGKGCTRARSGSVSGRGLKMGVVSEERAPWVWLEGAWSRSKAVEERGL